MTDPIRKPDDTRNFILRLAAVVVALVVLGAALLFGIALYQGTVSIPPALVTQLWVTIAALLTIGTTVVTAWFNARGAARIREEAARNAQFIQEAAAREFELNREITKQTAVETQAKAQEILTDLHDGLKKDFGIVANDIAKESNQHLKNEIVRETTDIVRSESEKRASELKATLSSDTVRQELAALKAAIESLKVMQSAPGAAPVAPAVSPLATDATVQAIEQNTRATAEHTKPPDEPGGTPV